MTFLWPSMLLLLLAVPVIVILYLRVQRRQRRRLENFGRMMGGQFPGARTPGFRRHIAPVLFLVGLVILLVALARPQAAVQVPTVEGTVILVFDISASMAAADVEPTRLDAAKASAREFVQSQPSTVQIGVVAFSGGGLSVQQPSSDSQAILDAIDRLRPANGTSVGQGILVALNVIAVDAGLVPENQQLYGEGLPPPQEGEEQQIPPDYRLLEQLPEGAYPAAVIVLLSDGENTQSIDPIEAAVAAADRSVPVHTLGFGTPAGATLEIDGFLVHTALNEPALQQIAQVTGGTYFNALGAHDPQVVYQNLAPQFVIKPEQMEVTSIMAGASIVVLLMGAVVSMVWFNRLP